MSRKHISTAKMELKRKPRSTSVARIVLSNKVTAKGVNGNVAKKLSFDNHEYCSSSLLPKRVDIQKIGLDLHRVLTFSTEKIGLSTL